MGFSASRQLPRTRRALIHMGFSASRRLPRTRRALKTFTIFIMVFMSVQSVKAIKFNNLKIQLVLQHRNNFANKRPESNPKVLTQCTTSDRARVKHDDVDSLENRSRASNDLRRLSSFPAAEEFKSLTLCTNAWPIGPQSEKIVNRGNHLIENSTTSIAANVFVHCCPPPPKSCRVHHDAPLDTQTKSIYFAARHQSLTRARICHFKKPRESKAATFLNLFTFKSLVVTKATKFLVFDRAFLSAHSASSS